MKKAIVKDTPEDFRAMFTDEQWKSEGMDERPWTIWVYEAEEDFEWDSYGASAGFVEGGTEVYSFCLGS